jgi:hypothetical protein
MQQLRDTLAAKTAQGRFNTRSVGRYLSSVKDRIIDGRVLRIADGPSGSKLYWVEEKNMERDNDAF